MAAYPVLAPRDTWFTQGNHGLDRNNITGIMIADSFNIPDAPGVTCWDASEALDGSITCMNMGSTLVIIGNGSGKIIWNTDHAELNTYFPNVTNITGTEFLISYPVLAPQDTWYKSTTITKDQVILITIYDKLADAGFTEDVLVQAAAEVWNADVGDVGEIKCALFNVRGNTYSCCIYGNGSGKISLNPESRFVFSNFSKMVYFKGAEFLDSSQCTKINGMFALDACLTSIDLSSLDFSSVTSTNQMFAGCTAITSIKLGNACFDKVTSSTMMFFGCQKATEISCSNWGLGNATSFFQLFGDCFSLTELDLSSMDTSSCTSMSTMFDNDTSLKKIRLGKKFKTEYLELPATDSGYWYSSSKKAYAPNAIPTSTYDVYYSDINLVEEFPVLLPQNTWFKSSIATMNDIEQTIICDNYNDTGMTEEAFTSSATEIWNADEADTGAIKCALVAIDGMSDGTDRYICFFIGNGSGKISLNRDSSKLFMGCDTQKRIDNAHIFDTSNVENFNTAFCSSKLPNQNSTALIHIDVSDWDVSNCTSMSMMFGGNWYLPELDVSRWDTSNVTNLGYAFMCCNALKQLDVSNWDVSKCTNFWGTFAWCYDLEELDVSKWKFGTEQTMNIGFTFMSCRSLKKLDLRNWPFSQIVVANYFWSLCSSLTELLLPDNWLVGQTSARALFQDMKALSNLDTSNWDTSSIEDMSFMFYGCSALKVIDVSNWDVSKVKNFDHFAAHALLRRKGIENWDTSSAENMNAMFHNCAETELDLSGFKTDKVQFFTQMFENSPNLKHIKGLDKWNTSNATGFDQMFGRCYALEELDLSSFDTRKACNGIQASTNGHQTGTLQNFVNDCRNLKWIKFGPNFAVNGDGTNTTAANKLILPTPSADHINGADGLWRTVDGTTYSPTGIPDRTLNTYYSSYGGICDVDVIVKNGSLLDTANAIRELSGATEKYTPSQFGAAIRAAAAALNDMADEILNEQAEHIEGGVSDVTTE